MTMILQNKKHLIGVMEINKWLKLNSIIDAVTQWFTLDEFP